MISSYSPNRTITLLLLLLAASVPRSAHADILSATLFESEDLPDFDSVGPRTFLATNAPVRLGEELTIANETANPSGFDGFLSIDLSANSFLLTQRETYIDFQTTTITFSSMTFSVPGQRIVGVNRIGPSIVDSDNSNPFTETVSFTGNSITLKWAVLDRNAEFNYVPDGTATYNVVLGSAVVPEAGTIVLALPALGMIGALAIRRRK